jgi:hypothetical protein
MLINSATAVVAAWIRPNYHRLALNKIQSSRPLRWLTWLVTAYACYKAVLRYYKINSSPVGNEYLTRYIAILMRWSRQPPHLKAETIRGAFLTATDIYFPPVPDARNHSHPVSCATRNQASAQVISISQILGARPYVVQMSTADIKNELTGCRTYHWTKDLAVRAQSFDPKSDDIVVMVDVDMYIDMPTMLSRFPRTYMISTFQPECVSEDCTEYSFTFNVRDEVEYHVSGGAYYKHTVWNYGLDNLLVSIPCDPLRLGLCWQITAYHVERRRTSKHHQIVLLTPIESFKSPFVDLSSSLRGSRLDILRPVVKTARQNFLRLNIVTSKGMVRSTSVVGSLVSATIPASQDDGLASSARISTSALTVATVKHQTGLDDPAMCSMLVEYHRLQIQYEPHYIVPVKQSVYRYQFGPEYVDEAKPSLHPFMHPLLMNCYAPDKCRENDDRAVQGRVIEVRNPVMPISSEIHRYINEFAKLVVPVPGKLLPVEFDEVYERQCRPAQRAILAEASLTTKLVSDSGIESFQKAEPYMKIADPRIISIIPPITKLHYSRYTYAFADLLRNLEWYAFGKTPLCIAERITELCVKSQSYMVMTDFSRFDGRVSNVLRLLERVVYMRAFSPSVHQDLAELMTKQYGQRATTRFGVQYDTGFSRASGSCETADSNSLDNAFVAYVALRRIRNPDGAFRTPEEAYKFLGIYGGDDGATPDIPENAYCKAAEDVGQSLEYSAVMKYEFGVNFLARYYSPDVWVGSLDSMCDLRRQLSKLHVTVALPSNITPLMKLGEKLRGYAAMDTNTPIIGKIIAKYKSLWPKLLATGIPDLDSKRRVANWYSQYELSVQYPNQNTGNWMQLLIDQQLPNFDIEKFSRWVDSVNDENSMLKPPLCEESDLSKLRARVMHLATVNGEVYQTRMCNLGSRCEQDNCHLRHDCRNGGQCAKVGCIYVHPSKNEVEETNQEKSLLAHNLNDVGKPTFYVSSPMAEPIQIRLNSSKTNSTKPSQSIKGRGANKGRYTRK